MTTFADLPPWGSTDSAQPVEGWAAPPDAGAGKGGGEAPEPAPATHVVEVLTEVDAETGLTEREVGPLRILAARNPAAASYTASLLIQQAKDRMCTDLDALPDDDERLRYLADADESFGAWTHVGRSLQGYARQLGAVLVAERVSGRRRTVHVPGWHDGALRAVLDAQPAKYRADAITDAMAAAAREAQPAFAEGYAAALAELTRVARLEFRRTALETLADELDGGPGVDRNDPNRPAARIRAAIIEQDPDDVRTVTFKRAPS